MNQENTKNTNNTVDVLANTIASVKHDADEKIEELSRKVTKAVQDQKSLADVHAVEVPDKIAQLEKKLDTLSAHFSSQSIVQKSEPAVSKNLNVFTEHIEKRSDSFAVHMSDLVEEDTGVFGQLSPLVNWSDSNLNVFYSDNIDSAGKFAFQSKIPEQIQIIATLSDMDRQRMQSSELSYKLKKYFAESLDTVLLENLLGAATGDHKLNTMEDVTSDRSDLVRFEGEDANTIWASMCDAMAKSTMNNSTAWILSSKYYAILQKHEVYKRLVALKNECSILVTNKLPEACCGVYGDFSKYRLMQADMSVNVTETLENNKKQINYIGTTHSASAITKENAFVVVKTGE
jgi:hypothetical protein